MVWGHGYPAFQNNPTPDWNSFDMIIMLENYSTAWVPCLAHTTKPLKFVWSIDSHVMDVNPHKKIFDDGKYHYFLQATSIFCDRVKNSLWFPNAYDDTIFRPSPENIKKQQFIGFCGSKLNRGDICSKIALKYPFTPDYWVLGNEMLAKIQSYKIHFNLNMNWDINYRNFETCGLRTCLVTNNNMNMDDYKDLGFIHGENCLFWDSRNDASLFSVLAEYEDDDVSIDKIATNGYNHVCNNHTYYHRAKSLIGILEGKTPNECPHEYWKE